jgi:hypothetical protein
VRAVRRVRAAKGARKCGSVGSVRDELHRALKNTGHLGPCGRPQDTKLYKSGRWGRECVRSTSLRPHASAVRSGIQGRATWSSERSETRGEKLLDFSSEVEVCSYMVYILIVLRVQEQGCKW